MKRIIRYALFISAVSLFFIGYTYIHFNMMLISIMILLSNNILYSLESLNKRIVFFFFNISFFTFLLGMYFTEMLNGLQWWVGFPNNIMIHTLLSLFISLLFLYIGSVAAESLKKERKAEQNYNPEYLIKFIRKVSKMFFYLTFIVAFIVLLERVIFVQQNGYVALYLDYVSHIPFIVKKIASTYTTFFYIYLATIPLKKEARPVIILQLFYLGMSILTGVRGTLMVGLFVILIYSIFRDVVFGNYDEKWLGKFEKTIIIAGVPFLLAYLSAYSIIRVGGEIKNFSLVKEFISFFESQGGSVQVISFCKLYENYLPSTNINYTFSPIINYFTIGSIAQIFSGLVPLMDKIDVALYGNNLGATITYLVNPQYYLAGGGMGTQYIAELYADFGYFGITIFNFIFGALLSIVLSSTYKKWWLFTIGLLMCNAIMDMPRNFALTWLGVWIALPTWIPIVVTYFSAKIIYERGYYKKHNFQSRAIIEGDLQ